MTLNISIQTTLEEMSPRITVIGVGGGGGNAVNNMIRDGLEGVDFLVANTDGQALAGSLAQRKIQLGKQRTGGLGAGSKPEIGRLAAEESIDEIMAEISDNHMVFITAGMGGGTGTGAASVIAKAARENGILTVGVVTKPFGFEGEVRMRQANAGIEELQAHVDTLITIPNQNLFCIANERTTFSEALAMADEVLHKGVSSVTDLIFKPGHINCDFADIRSIMEGMGKAMMGTGEASGERRAINAAEAAINNPLLDNTSLTGAQAILVNIKGGTDVTLFEVDEAVNQIRQELDPEAIILFGSAMDETMEGIMRVSILATSIPTEIITRASKSQIVTPQNMRPNDASLTTNHDRDNMAVMTEEIDAKVTSPQNTKKVEIIATDRGSNEAIQTRIKDEREESNLPESSTNVHTKDDVTEQTTAVAEESEDKIISTTLSKKSSHDKTTHQKEKPVEEEQEPLFTLSPTTEILQEEHPKSLVGRITQRMFATRANGKSGNDEISLREEPSVAMPYDNEAESAVTDTPPLSLEPARAEDDAKDVGDVQSREDKADISPIAMSQQEQPKLDIIKSEDDIDLEIPAFLRRQAN